MGRKGRLPIALYIVSIDAAAGERPALFLRKIDQACFVFDFDDPMSDIKSKEIKRAALNEIVDHITNSKGALTEPVYSELIRMVRGSEIVLRQGVG